MKLSLALRNIEIELFTYDLCGHMIALDYWITV